MVHSRLHVYVLGLRFTQDLRHDPQLLGSLGSFGTLTTRFTPRVRGAHKCHGSIAVHGHIGSIRWKRYSPSPCLDLCPRHTQKSASHSGSTVLAYGVRFDLLSGTRLTLRACYCLMIRLTHVPRCYPHWCGFVRRFGLVLSQRYISHGMNSLIRPGTLDLSGSWGAEAPHRVHPTPSATPEASTNARAQGAPPRTASEAVSRAPIRTIPSGDATGTAW